MSNHFEAKLKACVEMGTVSTDMVQKYNNKRKAYGGTWVKHDMGMHALKEFHVVIFIRKSRFGRGKDGAACSTSAQAPSQVCFVRQLAYVHWTASIKMSDEHRCSSCFIHML
jgi:hypothetical protein